MSGRHAFDTRAVSRDGRTHRSVQLAGAPARHAAVLLRRHAGFDAHPADRRASRGLLPSVGGNARSVPRTPSMTRWRASRRHKVDALILDLRGGFGGAGLEYLERSAPARTFRRFQHVLIDDGVRGGKEWLAATVRAESSARSWAPRRPECFSRASRIGSSTRNTCFIWRWPRSSRRASRPSKASALRRMSRWRRAASSCGGADPQLDKATELIRALPPPKRRRRAESIKPRTRLVSPPSA